MESGDFFVSLASGSQFQIQALVSRCLKGVVEGERGRKLNTIPLRFTPPVFLVCFFHFVLVVVVVVVVVNGGVVVKLLMLKVVW